MNRLIKHKSLTRALGVLFAAAIICIDVAAQAPTAFTYQGRLTDAGTAANGNYDLQFALFDSASGGTLVATQIVPNVAVSGGIFTVQLDFGANAFPGANRWLEISARLSGAPAFITLSPRQPITSTPYAIRTLSATAADTATNATNAQTATNATQLGGVAASQYVLTGDKRLTDARQPVAGSNNYIQNQSATGQAASFNIAGDGVIGGKVRIGTSDLNSAFRLAVEAPVSGVFVRAFSTAVNGTSDSSIGVFGLSTSNVGVHGVTTSGDSSSSGVHGLASGPPGGVGVRGEGTTGVLGIGTGQGGIAVRASGTSWFRGDTTPLNSTVASGTGIGIGSVPASNYGYIFGFDYSTNQARTLALNHPGGNVGIGTTTPARTLHVNGRVRIQSAPAEPSVVGVCFTNLGDVVVCGGSSLRLKTNVQPFAGGLNILRRLRPIRFDWKDGSGPDIGLGAEDVAQIAPSLTFTDDKGEVAGVKYERLNVLLINAVKEQQTQIEDLQRLAIRQQAQIASLNRRIRRDGREAAARGNRNRRK